LEGGLYLGWVPVGAQKNTLGKVARGVDLETGGQQNTREDGRGENVRGHTNLRWEKAGNG